MRNGKKQTNKQPTKQPTNQLLPVKQTNKQAEQQQQNNENASGHLGLQLGLNKLINKINLNLTCIDWFQLSKYSSIAPYVVKKKENVVQSEVKDWASLTCIYFFFTVIAKKLWKKPYFEANWIWHPNIILKFSHW